MGYLRVPIMGNHTKSHLDSVPDDEIGVGESCYPRSDKRKPSTHRGFANIAYILLGFTVLVALFGAFVRASLSGDGCGTSWPLCNGEVLPIGASAKTLVEFTHRATSGLLLTGIVAAYIWSRFNFEAGNLARKAMGWSVISTIISALIGAGLVLLSWVVHDKSVGRAITMPIHLVNNYFLLGSLLVSALAASGGPKLSFKNQGATGSAIKLGLGGFFILGMTGALSAMGKTAYSTELSAANTFFQRIQMHIGDNAAPLLRGGVLHPLVATAVGLLIVFTCGLVAEQRKHPDVTRWAKYTVGLFAVQFVFGIVNLVFSAPLWMQLLHLTLAIGNWLTLVVLACFALRKQYAEEVAENTVSQDDAPRNFGAIVKDYIALTKPRVISLLLFTTLAAMFIAEGGAPSLWLIIAVMVGGYASAGAANAYNMVIERDLDIAMERTSHRPTVGRRISNRAALIFATTLGVGSFLLLTFAANLLSACMALSGLLTYVFVYTLWLKRRTWQNIVIGGAAGAFPPLVGYAAVTGYLSPLAWFLFALIFAWTPVHFWALAILIKDDYAKAGVPMLPVVKGDRVTVIQIALYTVITVVVCALPLIQGQLGMTYLVGSGLLNFGLLAQTFKLLQDSSSKPRARALFKYSMIYLALIFIVIAIDQVKVMA